MAPRSRTTYGIEIGKAALCVAQYSPADNAVANVAVEMLQGTGPEWWSHVQDKLGGLSSAMELAGQDAVCSVPAESVVIKHLVLDKDESGPDDVIRWELSQQVVGSMDDYALDSEKVSEGLAFEPSGYLAVACRKAAVSRIAALLRSLKVKPVVVDVDLFAAINVFEANYRENSATPCIIVLGSEEFTKVALTADGRFVDYEHFKNGSGGLDPEKYADAVKAACAQLRFADGRSAAADGLALYATGPVFTDEDFTSRCLKELGRAEPLNPFRTIACRAAMPAEAVRAFSSQLAVAVGLALRGGRK